MNLLPFSILIYGKSTLTLLYSMYSSKIDYSLLPIIHFSKKYYYLKRNVGKDTLYMRNDIPLYNEKNMFNLFLVTSNAHSFP